MRAFGLTGRQKTFEERFSHWTSADVSRGQWRRGAYTDQGHTVVSTPGRLLDNAIPPADMTPLWRWSTHFPWGWFGERTLESNQEAQWYVPVSHGKDLHRVVGGRLQLRARRASAEERRQYGGRPWLSALLTTYRSFGQRYGLFTMRAKLPKGRGAWPAFWLLPNPHPAVWPPEIDILEYVPIANRGDQSDRYHIGWVVPDGRGGHRGSGHWVEPRLGDLSRDFHDWSFLWTPTTMTWFMDGRALFEAPTPPELHVEMFILVNLAVGGNGQAPQADWTPQPDATTPSPMVMEIERIEVYSPTAEEAAETPAPGRRSMPRLR